MENHKSLGKKEIIECLQEWRENILCDINNEENWERKTQTNSPIISLQKGVTQ